MLIVGLGVMILGGYDDVELSVAGIVVAMVAGTSFAGYTECGSRAIDLLKLICRPERIAG